MASSEDAALLDALVVDLRAKFERYGVGQPPMLNAVGFRYCLRGCVGLDDLTDAALERAFATGLGGAVATKSS
jgi:hypothetical protein